MSSPIYIYLLHLVYFCSIFQEVDVNKTKNLLILCHKYFDLNHVPDFTNDDMPPECTDREVVHNLVQYILDYKYTVSGYLRIVK